MRSLARRDYGGGATAPLPVLPAELFAHNWDMTLVRIEIQALFLPHTNPKGKHIKRDEKKPQALFPSWMRHHHKAINILMGCRVRSMFPKREAI